MQECFTEKHNTLAIIMHLFQNSSIHIFCNNPKIRIIHPKSVAIKMNAMYNYSKFKLEFVLLQVTFIIYTSIYIYNQKEVKGICIDQNLLENGLRYYATCTTVIRLAMCN